MPRWMRAMGKICFQILWFGISSRRGKKRKHDEGPPKAAGPCWFCLSSAEVLLMLWIANNNYQPGRWRNISSSALATTATWLCPRCPNYLGCLGDFFLHVYQGGLTDDHVLILPIGHQASQVQKFLSLTSASQHCCQMDLTEEGEAEVSKFKSALKKMYKRQASSNGIPFFLVYGSVNYFNTTGKSAGVLWEELSATAPSNTGFLWNRLGLEYNEKIGGTSGERAGKRCHKSVPRHCLFPWPWSQRNPLACPSFAARCSGTSNVFAFLFCIRNRIIAALLMRSWIWDLVQILKWSQIISPNFASKFKILIFPLGIEEDKRITAELTYLVTFKVFSNIIFILNINSLKTAHKSPNFAHKSKVFALMDHNK